MSVGPPGTFSIRHVAANVPDTRKERIRRAYEKKASKLAAWRSQANARSVLIFEENDIQLTNAHLVADVLIEIERDTIFPKPDEIYLVSSCSEPWYVWALRIGGQSYDDFSTWGESLSEIDPAQLRLAKFAAISPFAGIAAGLAFGGIWAIAASPLGIGWQLVFGGGALLVCYAIGRAARFILAGR